MTRVKICGLTNVEDALAAADAGADLLGFNFYRKSPRYVEPQTCQQIAGVVRREFPHLRLVGVYVNSPEATVREIMDACGLDLAQLHGDEPSGMVAALQGRAFKAVRLYKTGATGEPQAQPEDLAAFAEARRGMPPALLVDASVSGIYGGSGQLADWSAAAVLSARMPLLLAGGLTPGNVGAALQEVHPWGVDVASGVEISPGRKAHAKMQAFIAEVGRQDAEFGRQPETQSASRK